MATKSLDEIFYSEFNEMMHNLKAEFGDYNLESLLNEILPVEARSFNVDNRERVYIVGVNDECYSKLNNTEALLWGSSKLSRRKYDYQGKPIRDKVGNLILQEVSIPRGYVAIISSLNLGISGSYKSKDGFECVDSIEKEQDGVVYRKYIYIVPRGCCYKVNQTALVVSKNKLRVYYSGVCLSLTKGWYIYLYIVPYKPKSVYSRDHIPLLTKTGLDYSSELSLLRNYWLKNKIMFDPSECELLEAVRGRTNMAVQEIEGILSDYELYDISASLDKEEVIEDYV